MPSVDLASARQLALVRISLGSYLAVSFGRLIPDVDLLAQRSLLPEAWSPLPNGLALLSPAPLGFALIAAAGMSLLYAAGVARRPLAVALWYAWTCTIDLTPPLIIPSDAYIGWLLVATVFVPQGESLRFERVRPDFSIPREVVVGAWLLLALGYCASGIVKLASPAWQSGEALGIVLASPISSPLVVANIEWVPAALLQIVTFATLALECGYPILCLSRATRPLAWAGAVTMHVCTLGLLQIESVSVGMLIFHLWVFDPRWPIGLREALRRSVPSRACFSSMRPTTTESI